MLSALQIFGQTYTYTPPPDPSPLSKAFSGSFLIFGLIVGIFLAYCMAKLFMKAGRKWWEAIIPIYNNYVLLKIAGLPDWWLILLFIPFVNIVIAIISYINLAKAFGKSAGIGVVTFLLPIIMLPVFAFSKDYQYVGAAGNQPNQPSAGSSPPVTPPSNPVDPAPTAQSVPPNVPQSPPQPPITPPSSPIQWDTTCCGLFYLTSYGPSRAAAN